MVDSRRESDSARPREMSRTIGGFTRTRTQTQTQSTECAPVDAFPLQRVLVFVGVIGSGKSTLSKAIVEQLDNWTRVCQDELGNRAACEARARSYLTQGNNLIIDRQNFDAKQRSHFVRLAREFQVELTAVVFEVSPDECARRLKRRTNHPTIESPEKALELLDNFLDIFDDVDESEGFDRIFTLPSISLSPSRQELLQLISAIDAAPKNAPRASSSRGRGRGSRGNRARGRGAPRSQPSRAAPFPNPWQRARGGSSPRGNGGNRLGGSTTDDAGVVDDAAALRARREAAIQAIEARRAETRDSDIL